MCKAPCEHVWVDVTPRKVDHALCSGQSKGIVPCNAMSNLLSPKCPPTPRLELLVKGPPHPAAIVEHLRANES